MTLSSWDSAIAQLVGLGWSYETAAAEIRRQRPELAPALIEDQQLDRTREKEEQAECVKIYRAHGCLIYSTSQYRAARVSVGQPDLLVFQPRVHAFWFHEVKRPAGGRQSSAQCEFEQLCRACGIRYVLGDRRAAWQTLRDLGVAE